MKALKSFVIRNFPVFILGGLILAFFVVVIIVSQNRTQNSNPAQFKKTEAEIFTEREATNPDEENTPQSTESDSLEKLGEPLFYGEVNPSLRDEEGFPVPPQPGTQTYPAGTIQTEEDKVSYLAAEREEYDRRIKVNYIDYTENGFSPKDSSAYTGQLIVWTNKTTKPIKLVQTLPKFDEFKEGVVIEPGKTFEFRPTKNKLFTYIEEESKSFGSIIIVDVTAPLLNFGN